MIWSGKGTLAWMVASLAVGALAAPVSAEEWNDFVTRDAGSIVMADSLAAITDKASRDLLGKPVDQQAMIDALRRISWKTRSQIIQGGANETAAALRHAVFTVEGLMPDQEFAARAEPATALLSEVLQHRRGVCLSLSLIYLAAADEAALPVLGVSVPEHFFVRYDNGDAHLNLETLDRGGTARSDNFYRRKFFVRKGEPFYMNSLTKKESLAVYLSQLAALYNRAGKSVQAVELLEAAQAACPSDPEIRTNLGVALRASGRPDDAILAWQTAIILDTYDDVAHFNLAAGLADRGEWLAAIHHFDEAMRLGHAYDLKLLRRLEPHRPDALYDHAPRESSPGPKDKSGKAYTVLISTEAKA